MSEDKDLKNELETSEEKGASLVEYALLVALIAVVAILAVQTLGTKISAQFSQLASTL